MSKFLSLDWFKGRVENSIDRVIANKLDNMTEEDSSSSVIIKQIKLVNDQLTVVTSTGRIFTKPEADEDTFHEVNNAKTEQELECLMMDSAVADQRVKERIDIEKAKALQIGIDAIIELDDFKTDGNNCYLVGTNRTMPSLLVEKFIEVVYRIKQNRSEYNTLQELCDRDDEYQSLKNFFMWCCLNPRAEVANELYRFLQENSFRITKQGFFVALRNVVTLHGSPELVHFISNTYNKVKAVWGKKPKKYTVFLENGEYKIVHRKALYETRTELIEEEWDDYEECYIECEPYENSFEVPIEYGEKIGNLQTLYIDLPNRHENRFTDDWTKTFDIRIGKPVSMPKESCNWSTQDCAAAGLHFTADQIHYVGCGDQSVLVLINPMKVVGIGEHKGRCYEYLPIMTVPREEATTILHDLRFNTLMLDEDYAIRELEELETKAKEGFTTEINKHEFNIPHMSYTEIEDIVANLSKMRDTISERVSRIE
tara:strand:+ start:1067 stop:2515 length:1449 start_codon:yes stop_codon:yes gene_type:complete